MTWTNPPLIGGADLAEVWGMNENLDNQARHRISEKPVSSGWLLIHSPSPGQNGGFPTDSRQSHPSIPAILGNPENPLT